MPPTAQTGAAAASTMASMASLAGSGNAPRRQATRRRGSAVSTAMLQYGMLRPASLDAHDRARSAGPIRPVIVLVGPSQSLDQGQIAR